MTKLEIVRLWMAEGKIIHPLERNPNVVDLVRTLVTLCGYREFNETRWIKVLKQELLDDTYRKKASDHYLFVLVEGLGSNLAEFFPPGGFFESHYLRELHSVFPSAGICALTSLVTAQWPGRHGLTGRYTHLPEHGRTAILPRFVDRITDEPLSEAGLRMEEVVLQPSLMTELEREVCTILPAAMKDGSYSQWAHGATKVIGYRSLSGGFQAAAANIRNRTEPSLTLIYIPELDAAEHETGIGSAKVKRIVRSLDGLLARLRDVLVDRGTRMVVSGGHGLIEVPPERQIQIETGDRMLDYLDVPPSGEPLMPVFHVKSGREKRFEEHFASSFGSMMELLSVSDAEALGLYGPEGIDSAVRRRLGSFIGIAPDPLAFTYHSPRVQEAREAAFHGGLHPATMQVPLFIV